MNTVTRIPMVVPFAATITVALFWMMRGLIDIGPVIPENVEEPPRIEIAFEIDPYDPMPTRLEPEMVETVEPPDIPRIDTETAVVDDNSGSVQIAVLPEIERGELRPTEVYVPDANEQPVVRMRPVYPPRMASRGVEGSCQIGFDVTPQGNTANVHALYCTNDGFAAAAVRAVSGWRYRPQTVDGQAVMRTGKAVEISFRLDG